jgi:hypothetical protein
MLKKLLVTLIAVILILTVGFLYLSFLRFQHKVHQRDAQQEFIGYENCVRDLGSDPAGLEVRKNCGQVFFNPPPRHDDGIRDWLGID